LGQGLGTRKAPLKAIVFKNETVKRGSLQLFAAVHEDLEYAIEDPVSGGIGQSPQGLLFRGLKAQELQFEAIGAQMS
jgi:hypothetical protein